MRTVKSFNADWYFVKDTEQMLYEIPNTAERISLPHTWNNEDGQDGGNDYLRTRCLYMKRFSRCDLPDGELIYLEVLAANSYSEVFINGKKISSHLGGYSLFRAEMTHYIKDENLLVISVDNREMLHAYPSFADFTFYGGLYRGVNVIGVPKEHIDLEYYGGKGIKVTPKFVSEKAEIDIEAYFVGISDISMARYTVYDKNGRVVASKIVDAVSSHATLTFSDPHLWQGVCDPYLYSAEVCLMSGDSVVDSVKSRFGIRTFHVDPDKGFFLNGKEYRLRGVSRHQDKKGIGNALTDADHREDISLIREMGANTIRLAHYQHSESFYDLCDEAGIVVWAEIPYISKHKPEGRENTVSQLTELIIQCYNHPSICIWGLSNEITMSGAEDPDLIENHRILNELAHELDPTRLTAVAAVSTCDINAEYLKIPDLVAYNHYFGWYGGDTSMNGPWFDNFHKVNPKIPIGVSEYGCEGLDWHTSTPTQGDYSEEYQAYYHEELIKTLFTRPYIFATYVWNMFDFAADARNEGGEPGINHKGLVTFDRKYKKDSFFAYKAWLSDEPFVHICSKNYVDRVEPETEIKVYSNQPSVELFVDGESVCTKTEPNHFFTFKIKNKGSQAIAVFAGECKDEARIRKVDEPNGDYILKETGTVLNWFDITEREGYLSINDKIDDILKTKGGGVLFAELISGFAKAQKSDTGAGLTPNEDMMRMLGGFTLLRFLSMSKMMGVDFTKEELLEINKRLNQIPKK